MTTRSGGNARRTRSLLEYAILGLVRGAPRSGYAIRKVFASSLLRLFSDSPGSIYPALRRLERDGLVTAGEAGRRGYRPFRLSRPGKKELVSWVATPMEPEELWKNPDAFSLQFANMADLVEPAAMRDMLDAYAQAFRSLDREVREFQETGRNDLTTTGDLVLNLGSGLCRARVRWARQTIRALQRGTTKGQAR